MYYSLGTLNIKNFRNGIYCGKMSNETMILHAFVADEIVLNILREHKVNSLSGLYKNPAHSNMEKYKLSKVEKMRKKVAKQWSTTVIKRIFESYVLFTSLF
jgi:hypothetical protein